MDLRELEQIGGGRHPWETARVEATKKILASYLYEGIKILDVGCGDGFVSRTLSRGLGHGAITAVDINFTEEQICELQNCGGSVRYLREPPEKELFQILLVMDVIEHVEDDRGFLGRIVTRHLAPGGHILITVPSFQTLFGAHDLALGHYRRYSLPQLEGVATASRLQVLSSGYLFGTLLLPKIIYNRLLERSGDTAGVGKWSRGRVVTSLVEGALNADNALLVTAARMGLKIPGLSAWALCQKE